MRRRASLILISCGGVLVAGALAWGLTSKELRHGARLKCLTFLENLSEAKLSAEPEWLRRWWRELALGALVEPRLTYVAAHAIAVHEASFRAGVIEACAATRIPLEALSRFLDQVPTPVPAYAECVLKQLRDSGNVLDSETQAGVERLLGRMDFGHGYDTAPLLSAVRQLPADRRGRMLDFLMRRTISLYPVLYSKLVNELARVRPAELEELVRSWSEREVVRDSLKDGKSAPDFLKALDNLYPSEGFWEWAVDGRNWARLVQTVRLLTGGKLDYSFDGDHPATPSDVARARMANELFPLGGRTEAFAKTCRSALDGKLAKPLSSLDTLLDRFCLDGLVGKELLAEDTQKYVEWRFPDEKSGTEALVAALGENDRPYPDYLEARLFPYWKRQLLSGNPGEAGAAAKQISLMPREGKKAVAELIAAAKQPTTHAAALGALMKVAPGAAESRRYFAELLSAPAPSELTLLAEPVLSPPDGQKTDPVLVRRFVAASGELLSKESSTRLRSAEARALLSRISQLGSDAEPLVPSLIEALLAADRTGQQDLLAALSEVGCNPRTLPAPLVKRLEKWLAQNFAGSLTLTLGETGPFCQVSSLACAFEGEEVTAEFREVARAALAGRVTKEWNLSQIAPCFEESGEHGVILVDTLLGGTGNAAGAAGSPAVALGDTLRRMKDARQRESAARLLEQTPLGQEALGRAGSPRSVKIENGSAHLEGARARSLSEPVEIPAAAAPASLRNWAAAVGAKRLLKRSGAGKYTFFKQGSPPTYLAWVHSEEERERASERPVGISALLSPDNPLPVSVSLQPLRTGIRLIEPLDLGSLKATPFRSVTGKTPKPFTGWFVETLKRLRARDKDFLQREGLPAPIEGVDQFEKLAWLDSKGTAVLAGIRYTTDVFSPTILAKVEGRKVVSLGMLEGAGQYYAPRITGVYDIDHDGRIEIATEREPDRDEGVTQNYLEWNGERFGRFWNDSGG